MIRLAWLALLILLLPGPAGAGAIEDATGRRVEVPDHIGRVFPAGPPAAALLYAVAPQVLLGWAHEPGARDRGYIAAPYASLPKLGALTGRAGEVDPQTLVGLRPDLVLDVGTVSPRYIDLAEKTQSETGLAYVLLDGRITALPKTIRQLGVALGVAPRAEALAAYAERTLTEVRARMAAVPAERASGSITAAARMGSPRRDRARSARSSSTCSGSPTWRPRAAGRCTRQRPSSLSPGSPMWP